MAAVSSSPPTLMQTDLRWQRGTSPLAIGEYLLETRWGPCWDGGPSLPTRKDDPILMVSVSVCSNAASNCESTCTHLLINLS